MLALCSFFLIFLHLAASDALGTAGALFKMLDCGNKIWAQWRQRLEIFKIPEASLPPDFYVTEKCTFIWLKTLQLWPLIQILSSTESQATNLRLTDPQSHLFANLALRLTQL